MGSMKVTLDREAFKHFLETLRSLTDEVRLCFTRTRVTAVCIDPSHVAMVAAEMPVKRLKGLRKRVEVGLGLIQIHEFIKAVKKKANEVEFEFQDDNSRVILSAEGTRAKVTLSTIHPGTLADTKMPKLDPPVSFMIKDPEAFKEAVKTIDKLRSSVQIDLEVIEEPLSPEQKLLRITGGDLTDTARYEDAVELEDVEILDDKELPIRSLYPLDYMVAFVNQITKGMTLSMSFSDDFPLRLEMNYNGIVRYTYMIAPRIEQ